MHHINCSVKSCAYNKDQLCHAGNIKIGGDGARITETTCCETYVLKDDYTNDISVKNNSDEINAILCDVHTCAYNCNSHCSLKDIEVGCLQDVTHPSQTDCLSFERK